MTTFHKHKRKLCFGILALPLLLSNARLLAQSSPTYVGGVISVGAGRTLEWYGNVEIASGTKFYLENNAKVYFYGDTLKLGANVTLYGSDGAWTNFTAGIGTGSIIFKKTNPNSGTGKQQVLIGGNTGSGTTNTITSINIDNQQGVQLVSSAARIGSAVNFVNGRLYTNGQDIRLGPNGAITGYDQNKYIVTNGTGDGSVSHVVAENIVAPFTFPVGMADGDYTPATITPTTSNTVHVNVTDYAHSASRENTDNSTGFGMQRVWNIYGDATGGNTTIALQHNSSTNQALFQTAANYVTRFLGNSWEVNTAAASSAGVPAAGTELRSLGYSGGLPISATSNQAFFSKGSADLLNGPLQTSPDFNVTYVNAGVTGNVSTNDTVPAGTVYGAATAMAGYVNPNAELPVMNTTGIYTFASAIAGKYQFAVPVCYKGVCSNELLQISVLDNVNPFNAPVVNNDVVSTLQNTAATVAVLGNDQSGTPGFTLQANTVSVTRAPFHGTAVANLDGTIKYTPATGFVGRDTFQYKVCDNVSPAQCGTALVYINVIPTGGANTTGANDDYVTTPMSTPVNGNVLRNDHDAEGDAQYAVTQNISVQGKGSFVLNANGSFTFTPVSGFIGSVGLPYAIYDNGTPVATAKATLYVQVQGPALQTRPDFNVGITNRQLNGDVSTNDEVPSGVTYGPPVPLPGYTNPVGAPLPQMNVNGGYTFSASVQGLYQYSVPVCYKGICVNQLLRINILDDITMIAPPVLIPDITKTKQETPVIIPVLANDQPGTPGVLLDTTSVKVTDNDPAKPGNTTAGGTAVVQANGSILYTPPVGFTGVDTVLYGACDDDNPSLCSSSFVMILVEPTGSKNTTIAEDDYAMTPGTAITGNVLSNDNDPEGDMQFAMPQDLTIQGRGRFKLNADGTYTFTPVYGFVGSVNIPYAIYDNGNPIAHDAATLHISAIQAPDFVPTIVMDNYNLNATTPTAEFVVSIAELARHDGLTTPPLSFRVLKSQAFNIGFDPAATTANVSTAPVVNNSDWDFTQTGAYVLCTLKPGKILGAWGSSSVGFTITRTSTIRSTQTLGVIITGKSGGDSNGGNNIISARIEITAP